MAYDYYFNEILNEDYLMLPTYWGPGWTRESQFQNLTIQELQSIHPLGVAELEMLRTTDWATLNTSEPMENQAEASILPSNWSFITPTTPVKEFSISLDLDLPFFGEDGLFSPKSKTTMFDFGELFNFGSSVNPERPFHYHEVPRYDIFKKETWISTPEVYRHYYDVASQWGLQGKIGYNQLIARDISPPAMASAIGSLTPYERKGVEDWTDFIVGYHNNSSVSTPTFDFNQNFQFDLDNFNFNMKGLDFENTFNFDLDSFDLNLDFEFKGLAGGLAGGTAGLLFGPGVGELVSQPFNFLSDFTSDPFGTIWNKSGIKGILDLF